MKTYEVYLGCYEQFRYTMDAKNLVELRKLIVSKWPTLYTGRWFKVDANGCPKGAKRFYLNNIESKPILIIPKRG
jgi:hypothetical protein